MGSDCKRRALFFVALVVLLALTVMSLFTGVSDVTPAKLWMDEQARYIFLASRLPRTLALLLVGSAMSCAGLVMQLLTQNKFVEPATSGTTQSAALGILLITIFWPSAPLVIKMIFACVFALLGSLLLLFAINRVSLKSVIIVPLLGIMIGMVIQSLTTFLAIQFDLLQAMTSWGSGDFSSVVRGRYELLWLVGCLVLLAAWCADRFTIVGMGEGFSANMGLSYQKVMMLGLIVVAMISGISVVVVGALPFLGLVVPNVVSLMFGDHMRKNLPWICVLGAGIVLLCDIVGRTIYAPYDIPVGVILGVVGAIIFVYLILRRNRYAR